MEIDDLIIDVDEYIRQAALEENDSLDWSMNVRVDPAIWNAILDKDPDLEDKAVDNIGLPEAVVDRLSNSIWSWIRFQVTFQRNVSRTTLDRLKRDVYPGVRRAIAGSGHADYQDLIEVLDGGGSLPNVSAASRIQEMFAVHWRDVFVPCPSIRIEPFTDPDAVRRILADAEIAESEINQVATFSDARLHPSSSSDFSMWLAASGRVSVEFARELVGAEGEMGRIVAAQATATTPGLNAALAFDDWGSVRETVVRSKTTDLATQIYLAFDDTAWVRVQARAVLACNFGLLPPVFTTWNLGGSIAHEEIPDLEAWNRLRGSAEVRDRVRALYGRASDRAVTQALQLPKPMPYLTSQSISVPRAIEALARGFKIDRQEWGGTFDSLQFAGRPDLLAGLSVDGRWYIRLIAAKATNLPPPMRTQLNNDLDRRVREEVQWGGKWLGDQDPIESDYSNSPYGLRNWRELMKTYTESDPTTRHWTSEWSLRNDLWRGLLIERPDLAKWVAINQTVGPKLLDELAGWPDPEVRGWVADHRRVWIRTLVRLASDPDPNVRRYATYNARMPDAQLRLLATDSELATRTEAQRRLEVRAFADKFLKDPEWWQYLGNSPF